MSSTAVLKVRLQPSSTSNELGHGTATRTVSCDHATFAKTLVASALSTSWYASPVQHARSSRSTSRIAEPVAEVEEDDAFADKESGRYAEPRPTQRVQRSLSVI